MPATMPHRDRPVRRTHATLPQIHLACPRKDAACKKRQQSQSRVRRCSRQASVASSTPVPPASYAPDRNCRSFSSPSSIHSLPSSSYPWHANAKRVYSQTMECHRPGEACSPGAGSGYPPPLAIHKDGSGPRTPIRIAACDITFLFSRVQLLSPAVGVADRLRSPLSLAGLSIPSLLLTPLPPCSSPWVGDSRNPTMSRARRPRPS